MKLTTLAMLALCCSCGCTDRAVTCVDDETGDDEAQDWARLPVLAPGSSVTLPDVEIGDVKITGNVIGELPIVKRVPAEELGTVWLIGRDYVTFQCQHDSDGLGGSFTARGDKAQTGLHEDQKVTLKYWKLYDCVQGGECVFRDYDFIRAVPREE